MKVKAVIVDDEPLARQIICKYATDIPDLEITGECEDAIHAHKFLNENQVDLMFLDVNMPKISGLDFIKNLSKPPLVILTTAYTNYALESYELNILDYLKKPFSFERFFKAFQKAETQLSLLNKHQSIASDNFIFIKSNKKAVRINIDEITIIEGLGDYIKIHLKDNHYITNLTMKKMKELLPENEFFRIHKSFIIRLASVEAIEGNQITIGKEKIPIGNIYKQAFNELIETKYIK